MNVGVSGATGRMGQRVIETARNRDDVDVSFAIGTDADAEAGVPVVPPADVAGAIAEYDPAAIVDFSVPESAASLAEVCAAEGVALVVGTTGLEESHLSVVQEASGATPVLKATNFSRGIQALLRALGPALEALPGYDLELLETHHNGKRDAPSGTAKTVTSRPSTAAKGSSPVKKVRGRSVCWSVAPETSAGNTRYSWPTTTRCSPSPTARRTGRSLPRGRSTPRSGSPAEIRAGIPSGT